MDVADCFVCLGRENREVDRVPFGRFEFSWLARVDACHRKGLAGFQRDAVRLFDFADGAPFIVAVGKGEAVCRGMNLRTSACRQRRALIIGRARVLRFHSSSQNPQLASSMRVAL